jgi:hypothetical protein
MRNIRCDHFLGQDGKCSFRFSWEWAGGVPAFKLLLRRIEEAEIIEGQLFDEDSIINSILSEIYANGGAAACASRFPNKYESHRFSSSNAIAVLAQHIIHVEHDSVYFITFWDDENNKITHLTRKTSSDIPLPKVTEISLDGMFRKSNKKKLVLSGFNHKDQNQKHRKIFIKCGGGADATYSLLPDGVSEFYVDKEYPSYELHYLTKLLKF